MRSRFCAGLAVTIHFAVLQWIACGTPTPTIRVRFPTARLDVMQGARTDLVGGHEAIR